MIMHLLYELLVTDHIFFLFQIIDVLEFIPSHVAVCIFSPSLYIFNLSIFILVHIVYIDILKYVC